MSAVMRAVIAVALSTFCVHGTGGTRVVGRSLHKHTAHCILSIKLDRAAGSEHGAHPVINSVARVFALC